MKTAIGAGWETADAWFGRRDARDEHEAARLRRYEAMMEDSPGRPNSHAIDSAFISKHDETDWKDDRHYLVRETQAEVWSERANEKLRRGVRWPRAKKRHFSHVRAPRPVPQKLVEWAKRLGVDIAPL